ncbi:DUF4214 domain-containing protein [Paludisphaera mucosa]|uniref:DUF4214 domain-containing protein n=1 Tax=Paludisphaera mucosa TaxID=3030827 RepID=A0ABT6FA45_9BACT|nr:DUF4214 domain-containing protein [Paludisphaera mucosa]MDG3004455.1 DUF4214 domain-containing protein [Paludisphaera mucosa]
MLFKPACESLEGRQLLNGTPSSLQIGTVQDTLTYGTTLGFATNPTTVLDADGQAVPGVFRFADATNDVTETVLDVGHYDLTVTFTPVDAADYESVVTTASIDVVQAHLQIRALDATRVYGQADPDLTSAIFIAQGSGWVEADPPWTADGAAATTSSAGVYAIHPTEITEPAFLRNYDIDYVDGRLTITRAIPALAWSNPADIVQGAPLGAKQLDATASVPGVFTYTPAAGTVLNAGAGQALTVAFTPSDPSNFIAVGTSVRINVAAAPPASAREAYDRTFIITIYREMLGRSPEPADLTYWVARLSSGISTYATAQAIWGSAERRLLVQQHRAPAVGFSAALNASLQAAKAAAGVVPAQPTPRRRDVGFVTTLYRAMLGREPEPAGLAYWVDRLLAGASAYRVAQGIWNSPERRLLVRLHQAPAVGYSAALNDALRAARRAGIA